MRGFIWTDDLSDRIARDAESWTHRPADLLTWACLCGGFLTAAAIVAVVLWVAR